MNIERERRSSSRIQFNRLAKLDFNTKVHEECVIQNLSLTGMFVHGDLHQNEGDLCVVNLPLAGKYSNLSLEAYAKVIRKEDNGVAFKFTSMPLDSLMLLQMILYCEDGKESLDREIKSLDNIPFKVHDDLLRCDN